jgi:hypothetical protein
MSIGQLYEPESRFRTMTSLPVYNDHLVAKSDLGVHFENGWKCVKTARVLLEKTKIWLST